MPRSNRPDTVLCLSISKTALALAIPRRLVNQYLDVGKLELRQVGQMQRIPVSSIAALIETWPLATRKRKAVPHGKSEN
jgi:hypothetical protein